MSSNELTLRIAHGITLVFCVKCQHHYGAVCVCVRRVVEVVGLIKMQGSIPATRGLRERDE